jgi:isoleucyl-tRNA synthetase
MLSTWYLRRSRRRFWKSGSDADKLGAYATLYETLATLSKLLAPAMPFLAEEMYQNLFVFGLGDGQEKPAESVHLATWPEVKTAWIDPALNQQMQLVMRLASLGHAARNQAGIKVRQPLSQVAFSVGNKDEAATLEKFAELLADELNVKKVRLLGSAGEAVTYSLKPLPKQLGQKYKGLYPRIAQGILALDAAAMAQALLEGKTMMVEVEGQDYEIQPEEVEVRAEARSGLVVSAEGAYLAALSTELTKELALEGLAREFIRRLQDFRKQAGFEIADRIQVSVAASARLEEALKAYRGAIMGETLAVQFDFDHEARGSHSTSLEFDGETASLAISRSA